MEGLKVMRLKRPKLINVSFLGDYVDGEFVIPSQVHHKFLKTSPSDKQDILFEVSASDEHVDQAVLSAKRAFNSWSGLSFQQRADYLQKVKGLYQTHQDELAQIISRETGKPLWESKMEVRTMISKVDVTLNTSMQLIQNQVLADMPLNMTGLTTYKPRGVFVILGPYNFPGHLANGSIIPALATGNTVVFKPSEYTPVTGQKIASLFHQADLPKGVFNFIQGNGHVGEKLVKHPNVDGILFTGSYETGFKIKKATVADYWKILALEMGGKNASIVWKDADLDKAVYECIIGAFSTTGQRCSCSSRILVHKHVSQQFIEKFLEVAKKLAIGHWSQEVFMGALISKAAIEKYFYFQEVAQKEKADNLLKARQLPTEEMDGLSGHYVTPSLHLVSYSKSSIYQNSEIFGPDVAILIVNDLEEALEINNAAGYGLVASIFTKDQVVYQKALQRAKVGLFNWNRATVGANGKLPFGGWGKSGNDRPAGHFAVYACTAPVACLQDQNTLNKNKILPGVSLPF